MENHFHILLFHEIPINIRQSYMCQNEKILFSLTRSGNNKFGEYQEWYFFTTKHLVYMRQDEGFAIQEMNANDILEYHIYDNDIVLSYRDETIRIELDENNNAHTLMKEVARYWYLN